MLFTMMLYIMTEYTTWEVLQWVEHLELIFTVWDWTCWMLKGYSYKFILMFQNHQIPFIILLLYNRMEKNYVFCHLFPAWSFVMLVSDCLLLVFIIKSFSYSIKICSDLWVVTTLAFWSHILQVSSVFFNIMMQHIVSHLGLWCG